MGWVVLGGWMGHWWLDGWVMGWLVGGFMGWVVGGFMGWLCVWLCGWWWVGGWGVHRVGAYTHPPMNSYNVKYLIL